MQYILNVVKNHFKVLEVKSFLNCDFKCKFCEDLKVKISDLQVVDISLTSEFLSIDSKKSLLN